VEFHATLLSAWVAIILLSISFLTHCSAKGLSDPSPCTGIAGGSRPINNWLGASPVVELAKLLCTSVPGSLWQRGCSTPYHYLLPIRGIVLATGFCTLLAHLFGGDMLLIHST